MKLTEKSDVFLSIRVKRGTRNSRNIIRQTGLFVRYSSRKSSADVCWCS
ncbi:MAG: hypothetical protein RBS37_10300 [Bacteroidales bacterium]|nr:hypothetical protein [Bacteroidales bacterium]